MGLRRQCKLLRMGLRREAVLERLLRFMVRRAYRLATAHRKARPRLRIARLLHRRTAPPRALPHRPMHHPQTRPHHSQALPHRLLRPQGTPRPTPRCTAPLQLGPSRITLPPSGCRMRYTRVGMQHIMQDLEELLRRSPPCLDLVRHRTVQQVRLRSLVRVGMGMVHHKDRPLVSREGSLRRVRRDFPV